MTNTNKQTRVHRLLAAFLYFAQRKRSAEPANTTAQIFCNLREKPLVVFTADLGETAGTWVLRTTVRIGKVQEPFTQAQSYDLQNRFVELIKRLFSVVSHHSETASGG
jgi:hypothetical protein